MCFLAFHSLGFTYVIISHFLVRHEAELREAANQPLPDDDDDAFE